MLFLPQLHNMCQGRIAPNDAWGTRGAINIGTRSASNTPAILRKRKYGFFSRSELYGGGVAYGRWQRNRKEGAQAFSDRVGKHSSLLRRSAICRGYGMVDHRTRRAYGDGKALHVPILGHGANCLACSG